MKENIPYYFPALESWKLKTGNDGEILVIDDASTDASVQVLEKNKKKIFLIRNLLFYKTKKIWDLQLP